VPAPKICPTCGTEYPADERFCPRDGSALKSQDGGTDLIGSIIADRYLVLEKLGEGGMGRVYLAEHVKMGRKSAVKVMNPGAVTDADAISRFNREAANASRISHQHVAQVYDFGETSDGLIYLAMEYVEGEALTDILARDGAMPPERAGEIVRQIAEALSVAHDMGIVHRDLKPDNVMLAKFRDGSDCVKVVDFGIAKAAGVEAQKVTRTGLVIGTPEYMSPEQIAGDPLDGRSDIYSLGVVLFLLITGELPFRGATRMLLQKVINDDPPGPLVDGARERVIEERVLQPGADHLAVEPDDERRSRPDEGERQQRPGIGLVQDDDVRTRAQQLHRQSGRDRYRADGADRADARHPDAAHHLAHRVAARVRDQHAVVDPRFRQPAERLEDLLHAAGHRRIELAHVQDLKIVRRRRHRAAAVCGTTAARR